MDRNIKFSLNFSHVARRIFGTKSCVAWLYFDCAKVDAVFEVNLELLWEHTSFTAVTVHIVSYYLEDMVYSYDEP